MDKPSHISNRDIDLHRKNKLTGIEALAVDDHVAACPLCREKMADRQTVQAAYQFVEHGLDEAGASDRCLDYQLTADYVDDLLSSTERAVIDSHLQDCSRCAAAVADIAEVKQSLMLEMESGREAESGPVIAPQSPSLFHKASSHWIPLSLAASLMLIGGAAWLWINGVRTKVGELSAEVGRLRAQNEELQQLSKTYDSVISQLRSELDALGADGGAGHGSVTVVSLKDGGGLVTLDNENRLFGLEALPASYQSAVREALRVGRVAAPSYLSSLAGKGEMLMGPTVPPAFSLITPLGVVVESDRPAFQWTKLDGAGGYTVTIFDRRLRELSNSGIISATQWTPPRALRRGIVYGWQVRAVKDGSETRIPAPGEPEAKFLVLDQAKMDEMTQARRDYAGSHLVLGTLYARAGLMESAAEEFRSLLRANPESRAARRLLDSLSAYRK